MSRSSRRLVTIVAAATVATTLAACGGSNGGGSSGKNEASDTGITADSITLGSHYPLTGAAAAGYSTIPLGADAYFRYVNDRGGVNGRTITWDYKDDAGTPTRSSQAVIQLVLQDQVFAIMGGLGTPTHDAVVDFLNSEGVPDLFVASGSSSWGSDPRKRPETFGWQPDYESEGKILGQYISQKYPNAKVGLFLQDDDLGQEGEKGLRAYLDAQIVDAEHYTPGNLNVGPQVTKLQAAGADVVVAFDLPAYTALTQLTALQLGYKPQWAYSNAGSDPGVGGGLLDHFSKGTVPDAGPLDGALTTAYLPTVDQTSNPWIRLFRKVWSSSGGKGPLTNAEVYGMAQAYTTVQALQMAGKNPTRTSLVSALEKLGKNLEGPALAPFRYATRSHLGIGGMAVSQIQGNGGKLLTGVLTTDVGSAPIANYTGSEATPPSSGIPDVKPAS